MFSPSLSVCDSIPNIWTTRRKKIRKNPLPACLARTQCRPARRKKQRQQRPHRTRTAKKNVINYLFSHCDLSLTTKECRSSDVFSLSTKREIQKSTLTFALPQNFFTACSDHHHSGRRSHTRTTRRCRVS